MLTAKQCLARAVEMDQRANDCAEENLRNEMRGMSETWRHIAKQAEWQDAFTGTAILD